MNPFRVDIINLLNLIADFESQRCYQKSVQYISVPNEMVNQWFDDLYHPGSEMFDTAFSEEEKNDLAEFHILFQRYADSFSRDLEQLLHTNEWNELSLRAKRLLEKYGLLGTELNYKM